MADDPFDKLMVGLQDQTSAGPGPDSSAPTGSPDGAPAGPAPPPAPTGPPKLRGEAIAPAAPKPGEDLSLPTVLAGAAKNFTKSAAANIGNTAEALNPFNYGRDFSGLMNLGQGALSQAGIIDRGDPKAQAQHQAGLNALENMNWEHYGTLDNFLRTVRDDPATPIADAAAAASILAGGEGIAARVPGALGDALRAGTGVAKVAQYADPTAAALTVARKLPGVVSKIPGVGAATKIAGAVGGAGVGAALQHVIPIPGAGLIGGGYLGEKLAEGAMKVASNPRVRQVVSRGVGAVADVAPEAGAFGRTQPMTPAEQAAAGAVGQAYGGPGAPSAAPGGGPAPPTDPDSANLQGMEQDFGLIPGGAAAAATPSSGLQGAPPPNGIKAVIRQAEGGHNQPVGYMPTKGSARGAYQMIDSTYATNLRKYHPDIAAQVGNSPAAIRAFRNTPQGWALNETMGGQMVEDEITRLQHEGIVPTADSVGTYHMLGNTRLLHADPNTPIEQVTGADQRAANASAFRNVRTAGDFLAWMHHRNARAMGQRDDVPFADGGRVGYAEGGNVIDMTDALMRRAEAHHRAGQQDTKPMLGLSDDVVAKALRVAQAGI